MNFNHDLLISVIIPYHSIHKYLYRCINSVISQSYKPIEIILVNDACEDKLQFEKFIPTDIKILKHDVIVNSGPAAARNIEMVKVPLRDPWIPPHKASRCSG